MQRAGGGRPSRRTLLEHAAAAAVAVAAAVVMTWPLAANAADHVLDAAYHWDAYTNAMILGSRVDAVFGRGPLSLYDNYFFAPLSNTIVFNENLFGLSLLFAPFYLTTGNPLLAYNLTLLLSLSLSVFFTYLLVRRLTGSAPAGLLAGVAFAFCPYALFEIGRIQLVATQWIPACLLFLHRAVEDGRRRDVVGLWLTYLLQIGTCLYYALFLAPLLALAGAVLIVRRRPPKKRYLELAAGGAVAAGVALAMLHPYFDARDAFELERSLSFAERYDGKLDFFANVHETNRTLTSLHHPSEERGAYEEIAFPGFTVLALGLVAFVLPLRRLVETQGRRKAGILVAGWLAIALVALLATVLAKTMLAGALVLGLGVYWQLSHDEPLPFAGPRGLYLGLLLLSVLLFLGLSPLERGGEPVRGLYYYLYAYVPGFDGIRKVSRLAVMTSFGFTVLAAFGSAALFSRLAQQRQKLALLAALLFLTGFELRSFPHPVRSVWAGDTVPEAYRFLATLPPDDFLAIVPQNAGVARFRGDRGMALHNYLALYHRHRFVNGQSSYTLPVTELVRRTLQRLPDDGARRVLESVGVDHLLIHAEDLPAERRNLPALLAREPEHYRRIFERGGDSVFSLVNGSPRPLAETPDLPPGAKLIPSSELRAEAHLRPEHAAGAIDGNPRTLWSSKRAQARGQHFELSLVKPRQIIAFEIDNPDHVMDVPLSFELSVKNGSSEWEALAREPALRIFRQQIYSPKTFVFRVVLSEAALADRVRISVAEPLPGHYFTIHDARLYASGP